MKKVTLILFAMLVSQICEAQQLKIITTVESIVPMGIGRSRIIDEGQPMDYNKFATKRSDSKGGDEKEEKGGGGDRGDMKIDNFQETKLLNFYSGLGINFQNIASNDALISSKLNEMVSQGWELIFVTSGVESDAGKDDSKGIFITRYIFKKVK